MLKTIVITVQQNEPFLKAGTTFYAVSLPIGVVYGSSADTLNPKGVTFQQLIDAGHAQSFDNPEDAKKLAEVINPQAPEKWFVISTTGYTAGSRFFCGHITKASPDDYCWTERHVNGKITFHTSIDLELVEQYDTEQEAEKRFDEESERMEEAEAYARRAERADEFGFGDY